MTTETREAAWVEELLEQYRAECDAALDQGAGLYAQAMAGFNLARALRARIGVRSGVEPTHKG